MSKYLPIRVSTLRGDQPIRFDAYVKVNGKFILFCREGDSFENQRLERLKGKKLSLMYIPSEQQDLYDKYLFYNTEKAYSTSANSPIEIRAQIIQGVLQASVENLVDDLSNDSNYKVLLESGIKFKKFITSEPAALGSILSLTNHEFNTAHHAVNVAALAVAIADDFGFSETHPMQVPHMIMGALLHDVEHHFDNLDLTQPALLLPDKEKIIYNRHSRLGAEKIKQHHFYDSLISTVIEQHEERIDGLGLNGLKEKELHAASQIVSVANSFDQYLQYEKIDAREALRRILIDKMGLFSLEIMKALQNALKKRNLI